MSRLYILALVLALTFWTAPALAEPPASPEFFKTTDSDLWVDNTFEIQHHYSRVLVVTSGEAPETVSAAVPSLNTPAASAAHSMEYTVTSTYRTLQEAADAAQGGDLVLVMPGTYAGFVIGNKDDAGDGAYIHFKAQGKPGEVTIDRTAVGKDGNWMIILRGHHLIVEGFNLAGKTGPGLEPVGPRAGIFIDGSFRETSRMAHHIAVLGNFSHNHRSWGLHSTDSHSVLMQDNVFALSCGEHSAYVSDGSDNYCIRRNVFFGSRASGLQCNLDPDASLDELKSHPAFADYAPVAPNRKWADGLLKLATEKFGEHNFPDGRGVNFIIESNVVNGNGRAGGGSFNFAGLQDSVIQNNLVYANFTTGIAQWDNGNSFEAGLRDPGPQTASDVTGPDVLPYWGCRGNLIRNNTIVMNVSGRAAMLFGNGSWGNVVRNNIFANDMSRAMEVDRTSVYKLDSGYNVVNATVYEGLDDGFKALAVNLDEDNHSNMGVTREMLAAEVVKMNDEPWIIIEGNWCRLNPARPDFHIREGSKMLLGKGDGSQLPSLDIEGLTRSGANIGAYSVGKNQQAQ